ncbi:hypothetical protein AAC387_Pa02g1395 [Persea americana]
MCCSTNSQRVPHLYSLFMTVKNTYCTGKVSGKAEENTIRSDPPIKSPSAPIPRFRPFLLAEITRTRNTLPNRPIYENISSSN